MPPLPPLDCLRFFEAAARRESFAKAAEELHVSSSAVAHRIKVLEEHFGGVLFERRHRGVRLTGRGKAYLKDVQRILAEIQVVTERRRGESGTQRLKLVSVEAVAEKWLMPRLADFQLSHPGVVIELETNHRGVDTARRDRGPHPGRHDMRERDDGSARGDKHARPGVQKPHGTEGGRLLGTSRGEEAHPRGQLLDEARSGGSFRSVEPGNHRDLEQPVEGLVAAGQLLLADQTGDTRSACQLESTGSRQASSRD